jgi:tRNA modification GTPase
VSCGPHLIRLTDTAGLNAAPQALERLGMEKTLECVEQAGLLLVVLDPARPTPPFPEAVLRRVEQGEAILVVNKMDLGLPMPQLSGPFNGLAMAGVSSLQGIGIEELKNSITGACERLQVSMGSEVIAINARHADALKRALAGLEGARGKLAEGQAVELLASDLRSALDACGEISGRIDNERMLDRLFSTFCIGK